MMNAITYKNALIEANTNLARDDKYRFIGYGLSKGRALGTLVNVSARQIIEMPVAENLMAGLGIGLSLKGYFPVVFIERMDFLLNSLDAIVNHLDKIKSLSNNEFSPACIIRCVVGNKSKPLYTGSTHTQDFTEAMRNLVQFPVIQLRKTEDVLGSYAIADTNLRSGISTILVEFKDLV